MGGYRETFLWLIVGVDFDPECQRIGVPDLSKWLEPFGECCFAGRSRHRAAFDPEGIPWVIMGPSGQQCEKLVHQSWIFAAI